MKSAVEINNEYKKKKKAEKEALKLQEKLNKRREKIKAQYEAMKEKKMLEIKKQYERKLGNRLKKTEKQYEKMIDKKKRKILWKRELKKNKKTKTTARLKQELYTLVQLYVRLRDSDVMWYGKCISCDRVFHYKKMDWWHYIWRRNMITAFDPKNINAQCKYCNWQLKWNIIEYRKRLINKIWLWWVLELERSKWKLKNWNRGDIEDMIVKYKKLNKELEASKQQPLL